MNAALVMIDIILCLVPFNALHCIYPCVFTSVYVVFAGIYFAANGTNEFGEPFIYSVLDYGDSPGRASIVSLILAFVPAIVYVIPFLLAYLRDVTYRWITDNHPFYCCGMKTCTENIHV